MARAWRICSAVMAGGRPRRLAAGAGGVEAFVGALDDQFADEFRQDGEDVEDQAPAGGGVADFVQGAEADAALAESGHDGDQVLQGTHTDQRRLATRC